MQQTGQRLKEAREAKGLSLSEVSTGTKINVRVLQAIEEGRSADLPPKSFLRGFVRSYAVYLKIDAEEVLKIFHQEMGSTVHNPKGNSTPPLDTPEAPVEQEGEKASSERDLLSHSTLTSARTLKVFGVILVCALVVAFFDQYQKYKKEGKRPEKTETLQALPQKSPKESSSQLVGLGEDEKQRPSQSIQDELDTDGGKEDTELAQEEVDRKKKEQAEAERLEKEAAAKAEEERLAKLKAEKEKEEQRLAKEAEAKKKAEDERKKKEQAEAERLEKEAAAKVEEERLAKLKAEKEKEEQRLAKEAEAKKKAKAERERKKKERAEKERLEKEAAAQAEAERNKKQDTPANTPESLLGRTRATQEIIIEALDTVSVEIKTDGGKTKKIKLKPESLHTIKAAKSISLKFSDGGAVNVIHNGKDLGVPGNLGKSIRLRYPR
jgi:cytoskeletal protein RodZ